MFVSRGEWSGRWDENGGENPGIKKCLTLRKNTFSRLERGDKPLLLKERLGKKKKEDGNSRKGAKKVQEGIMRISSSQQGGGNEKKCGVGKGVERGDPYRASC